MAGSSHYSSWPGPARDIFFRWARRKCCLSGDARFVLCVRYRFSFSRIAKAWEHEVERGGFPSPITGSEWESKQLWDIAYLSHLMRNWAGDSPLEIAVRTSVCCGPSLPTLITLSPVTVYSGSDNHIKIIRIQFQYHESIAIFRFNFPSGAEIVVFISFSFKNSAYYYTYLAKDFVHIRETYTYKAKV